MKRTSRCSVDQWAIGRLSFRSLNSRRQRMRKRRIPLPRQTRGRDLEAFVSYRTAVEPETPSMAQRSAPETNKLPGAIRLVLWICVIIAGLILFGDLLARFFHEAPFAWPSINGEF
jgi:hypothetical protein